MEADLADLPAAIVNGVMQAVRAGSLSLSETGAAQFSVSNTGDLVSHGSRIRRATCATGYADGSRP
jgi:hypothetical protein